MTPRLGALVISVVFAACAAGPRGTSNAAPPEENALRAAVAQMSAEAEGLLRAQSEMVWASWTGAKRPQIGATYQGHESLFTAEAIHRIETLRSMSKDPTEGRALTALLSHFVGEYLAAQLSKTTDAVANIESSAQFTADGKDAFYRDLDRMLAAEKSAAKRREYYQAATAAVQRLSSSIRRREERKSELVAGLGYPTYEAFGAQLRQLDPPHLALLAEQVLTITEPAYQEVLGRMSSRELELPKDQLRRCDFPRLFRTPPVDQRFPAADLMPRAEKTLAGMGIHLAAVKSLHVDAADTPGKQPRALAVGVDVPNDVRISFRPTAGVRAQGALLGELGRALQFAFTTPQRFELRALGDVTASEAYAFLFEDLVQDPVWLEEHAGLSGAKLDQYLSTAAATTLYQLRAAAGRLLFELQLRRRGLEDARELYGPIMSRAYGVPFDRDDEERALVDVEDFYQSADDFVAWFLAGQIQGQMKARFGPAWWRQPASAAFLQGIWGRGPSLTAREVVKLIGEERLRPDVLLLRLSTMLKLPISVPANFGRELDAEAVR